MDFKPVLDWHTHLERGDRAELRRAHTPLELAVARGFHDLRNLLPDTNPKRVGQIARVLSFVNSHENKSFAKALKPVMSESRLRRLVECDREQLPAHLTGAIRLLKGQANVIEIADIVYWWGERRAQQLAYDYFGATGDSGDEAA
jgi:CRISPR type I-E-associated protein CasB/Cse2